MQFPHCDSRVLHAPGECKWCDKHPEWQELRKAWGINFTGYNVVETEWTIPLPCPADFNRPPGAENDHRRWAGNVATTQVPVNETLASKVLYDKTPWLERARHSWWERLRSRKRT